MAFNGTFGISSGMFRGGIGCLGGMLFIVLTAGAILGLLAMAWWGR